MRRSPSFPAIDPAITLAHTALELLLCSDRLDGPQQNQRFIRTVRAGQADPSSVPQLAAMWAATIAEPTPGQVTGPSGGIAEALLPGRAVQRTLLSDRTTRRTHAHRGVPIPLRHRNLDALMESSGHAATVLESDGRWAAELLASEGAVNDGAALCAGGELLAGTSPLSLRQMYISERGGWQPTFNPPTAYIPAARRGPVDLVGSILGTLAAAPAHAFNDADLSVFFVDHVVPVIRPTRVVTWPREGAHLHHGSEFARSKPAAAMSPQVYHLIDALDRIATLADDDARGGWIAREVRRQLHLRTGRTEPLNDLNDLWRSLIVNARTPRSRAAYGSSPGWGLGYLDEVAEVAERGMQAFDTWLHEGNITDRALRALRTTRGRTPPGPRLSHAAMCAMVLEDWSAGKFAA